MEKIIAITHSIVNFSVCWLGILLLCTFPAQAQTIYSPVQKQESTPVETLPKLVKAKVIYLGENHDSLKDHQAQLEIIQGLYQQNRQIAIALEMFQRPYQNVLNQYLAGKLTEAQLLQQSQYQKRWGFAWEYYAPILQFAKDKQLPVIALNTPTEVTRKVARQGLESLKPDELKYVPPLAEIRTDNSEYRQMVLDVFKEHQQSGNGNSKEFERFFLAQVLWDETMADAIASFLKNNPTYQVIVLAGQNHIVYGYGIPDRVKRRLGDQLDQRLILINPPAEYSSQIDKPSADYFWLSTK